MSSVKLHFCWSDAKGIRSYLWNKSSVMKMVEQLRVMKCNQLREYRQIFCIENERNQITWKPINTTNLTVRKLGSLKNYKRQHTLYDCWIILQKKVVQIFGNKRRQTSVTKSYKNHVTHIRNRFKFCPWLLSWIAFLPSSLKWRERKGAQRESSPEGRARINNKLYQL